MDGRQRVLLILRYLYENSDIDHWVSTRQIKAMLDACGAKAVSRTIDDDIEQLIASGHDISVHKVQGTYTRYKVNSRIFETAELKLMSDAVSASQFLGAEKTESVLSRLKSMAPVLDRQVLVTTLNTNVQTGILTSVDKVLNAIREDVQISFQLFSYTPDGRKTLRKNGKVYVFSPYDLLWVNDRYYLIGLDENEKIMKNPRVDHMTNVQLSDHRRGKAPESYDASVYYNQIYKAYTGPEYTVTLTCPVELAGKFIDRFGTDYSLIAANDAAFTASVRVAVGSTFFGWLFQYAGRMKIIDPPEVISLYRTNLESALKDL